MHRQSATFYENPKAATDISQSDDVEVGSNCILYTSMCVSLHTICSVSSMLKSWPHFGHGSLTGFSGNVQLPKKFLSFKWDIDIYTLYATSVLRRGRRMSSHYYNGTLYVGSTIFSTNKFPLSPLETLSSSSR